MEKTREQMQELTANLTPEGQEARGTPALEDLTTPIRTAPPLEEARPAKTTPKEAREPMHLIRTPNLASATSWSANLPSLSTGTILAWKSAMLEGLFLKTPL